MYSIDYKSVEIPFSLGRLQLISHFALNEIPQKCDILQKKGKQPKKGKFWESQLFPKLQLFPQTYLFQKENSIELYLFEAEGVTASLSSFSWAPFFQGRLRRRNTPKLTFFTFSSKTYLFFSEFHKNVAI